MKSYIRISFHPLLISIGVFLIYSCVGLKSGIAKMKRKPAVPNGIYINDSVMLDQTEVTNFAWKEYQYHIKSEVGEEAEEYKNTFPSFAPWQTKFPKLTELLNQYYFEDYHDRVPELSNFDNFPVVGVTRDQVAKYIEWRSDIVCLSFMLRKGIISEKDNYKPRGFTKTMLSEIAKNNKRFKSVKYYPKYELPTEDIMRQAMAQKSASESSIFYREVSREKNYFSGLRDNVHEYCNGLIWKATWMNEKFKSIEIEQNDDEENEVMAGFRCSASWIRLEQK